MKREWLSRSVVPSGQASVPGAGRRACGLALPTCQEGRWSASTILAGWRQPLLPVERSCVGSSTAPAGASLPVRPSLPSTTWVERGPWGMRVAPYQNPLQSRAARAARTPVPRETGTVATLRGPLRAPHPSRAPAAAHAARHPHRLHVASSAEACPPPRALVHCYPRALVHCSPWGISPDEGRSPAHHPAEGAFRRMRAAPHRNRHAAGEDVRYPHACST